jgi:molybdate/tungstate transport system substrate-binding protein
MSRTRLLRRCAYGVASIAVILPLAAAGQTPTCVPPSDQRLIIYRAGSLTPAFTPLVATFICQTGIQVNDVPMGSVDAARQITAGGHACDLYAPADDSDIELFMKPAGYATYTIVFARGRMVLAYSARGIANKKLPAVAAPNVERSGRSDSAPRATAKWYEILTTPGVAIGTGHPFLDPGAYRADMIFQLAEAYYHVPNLYNNLLEHVVIAGPAPPGSPFRDRFDFQLMYEHSARAMASADSDVRYVDLPDEINMSDPAEAAYYAQHARVVLPGLGTPASAQTVAVPGTRVAWGITVMKTAPNRDNAIKFLQLLLSRTGTAMLTDHGPTPLSPALVSPADFRSLPESLRPLVSMTDASR